MARNSWISAIIIVMLSLLQCTILCAQAKSDKLQITPLNGNFFIYTTYSTYEGKQLPAHGMYLVTRKGVVLFDTPWDTSQFQPLLDSIKARHRKQVTMCIATHWHSDRTEGLEYYRKLGIKTYTTTLTDELSRKNNKKRAEFLLAKDTLFRVGQYAFETFYPGEGHTTDNIIIWFGKERVLYGGCLIKGADAENLGYLGDGNTEAYEATLRRVQEKCVDPSYIVVSHHDWRDTRSLQHSIELARKLRQKKGP